MYALLALLVLSPVYSADPTPPNAAPAAPPAIGTMDEVLKLRDPFKRPDPEIGKGPPRTELEYYNLDAFKMVAVLTGPHKLRAMLMANDGKSFIVQSGEKIGPRNGVIRRITDEAVEVRERIFNILGKEENVDTEIPLQADPRARLQIRRTD
jgi:Tfp pilus assembly protein PilP